MSVQAHRPTNSFYVIARSLLPSSLSLMVTFLLSGLIVGGHILFIFVRTIPVYDKSAEQSAAELEQDLPKYSRSQQIQAQ